ncbi:divergent polysaccharide deacetylase family protein [Acetobacter sp.]|uniref:divergent polysaccharide deacetylase family protein n=1 Tax=Acetobacter sp. TaxID=440 RepID=UPI0039EAD039
MRPPITNDSPHLSTSGAATAASMWERMPSNGRLFVRFWGGVSAAALLCGLGLQVVSLFHHQRTLPAPSAGAEKQQPTPEAAPVATPPAAPESTANDADQDTASISEVTPGVPPISPPRPDMLEPVANDPGHSLPKRGPNGELPRNIYAAAVPSVPEGNARIAILLDGFGLSEEMSLNAARNLPASVSFAVPAYAPARKPLAEVARQRGHEIFLSLPMQPSTAPMDDEGPRALGYDHSTAQDKENLEWALSRFNGYVGVTNAFSGLDGDAYAQSPDFSLVAHELDSRGLLYLNATPGAQRPGSVMGGDASMTLDTNADATGVDGQLARLVALAKSRGSAIAVAGPMRPVLLQRMNEWVHSLASQGVSLVPVSALSRNDISRPSVSQSRMLHVVVPPGSSPSIAEEKVGAASGKRAVTAAPLPPPQQDAH